MMKRKKDNYKFWHSPIALLILFCLFLFFGFKIIHLIEKERETSEKKELILNEIEGLKNREISITEDMLKLKTDEGKEEIIREKYQVVKEGEKMVTIIDEVKEENIAENDGKSKHGLWVWIKGIFK